jgi:hypothetical protein
MAQTSDPIGNPDKKNCRPDGDDEAERVQLEDVARSDSVGHQAPDDGSCQPEQDRRAKGQVLTSRLDETGK